MLISETATSVLQRLSKFGEPGTVPADLARELIASSAWWIDHVQSPTRAPNDAERMDKGPHGWQVKYGGNYFLVERAIILSKRAIIQELGQAIALPVPLDGNLIYGRLITCVRVSVANSQHGIYPFYKGDTSPETRLQRNLPTLEEAQRYGQTPPSADIWKGFMKLGTHAIKVDAFVETTWEFAGLDMVCL